MPCRACLANFSNGGAEPPRPRDPPRRLVVTWAVAIAGLALASALSRAVPLLRGSLGGVAAFLFIVLADDRLRARGGTWREHGVPRFSWGDRATWEAYGRG